VIAFFGFAQNPIDRTFRSGLKIRNYDKALKVIPL